MPIMNRPTNLGWKNAKTPKKVEFRVPMKKPSTQIRMMEVGQAVPCLISSTVIGSNTHRAIMGAIEM